jgi:four helix bundle protein
MRGRRTDLAGSQDLRTIGAAHTAERSTFVVCGASCQQLTGWRGSCLFAGVAKLTSFRELQVWQKAVDLADRCYRLTRRFKRDDQDGLGYQIRKSCVSVPSNIAEGFGRHHTASYINHLWIANGSGNELQTQLEIGRRIEIVTPDEARAYIADAEEIGRMLTGLVRSLERSPRD